jgi:hypothetical protein
MGTRREHFEKLPEDLRALAVKYTSYNRAKNGGDLVQALAADVNDYTALKGAFLFDETTEGREYWESIDAKYFSYE